VFPNAHDFVYTEEERFMKQILSSEDCKKYSELIIVCHSMGTIFLQNFLAKVNIYNEFGHRLNQIHFVAPTRDFGDFKINSNWENITSQTNPENIFIYHSRDDQTCDFEDGFFYNQNMPGSNFIEFQDRGHFKQSDFPELFDNIG
jgi:predicted alpha/beta hydrolase family esterase